MKKLFFVLLILFPWRSVHGQKIIENRIDEFTKYEVVRTSWETLNKNKNGTVYFRISQIDDIHYWDLKMILPDGGRSKIFSIEKGAHLMLKSGDSVITIKNLQFALTKIGDGAIAKWGNDAYGIKTSYRIPGDKIETLKSLIFDKIRVYTNDGYFEFNVRINESKLINRCTELISPKIDHQDKISS